MILMKKLSKKFVRHIERLHHFSCACCGGWWTVGDAPPTRMKWFCPWCGKENIYKNENKKII
jgi:predicted RNA-binding Zn-ribbon protein involved in translation (DUF1610 family)